MKNKMIAGMLTAVLMAGVVMPVNAEEVTVTYREPNAYTLSIPASVTLTKEGGSTEVGVKDVNIEPNTKIDFKITTGVNDSGVIELSRENDTNTKALTTVSTTEAGAGIAKDTVFVSFVEDGMQDLYFSAPVAKNGVEIKAGSYKGTITFTVEAPELK